MSDVEFADASRFVFRTGERRWESWGFYYPTSTRGALLASFGLIEGAHDALGWTAAGGYSALVARDDAGAWRVFWNHSNPSAPLKGPEPLGCERALALGTIGYATTAASPFVVCADKVVHVRADRDPVTDALMPITPYPAPLSPFPPLEWATTTRHYSRGESSFTFAFESLSGTWEVNKLSVTQSAGALNFQLATNISARLGYGGAARPDPIYLHRDDAPGVPGVFPTLQVRDAARDAGVTEARPLSGYTPASARVHMPKAGVTGAAAWRPALLGGDADEVQYSELHGKLVATRRLSDDTVGFWVVDVAKYEELNLWSTAPSIVWTSPTGPSGAAQMRWRLIRGDYYNYISVLAPHALGAGAQGADVWSITLYSVLQCRS